MKRHIKRIRRAEETIIGAFEKLKIFERLSVNELQRLYEQTKVLRIKRTGSIVVEGEPTQRLYLLLSGIVKVSIVNEEARLVLQGVIVAGEIFGLHSLAQQPAHSFRCNAFTDCVIAQIPTRTFCQIVLPREPFDSFKAVIEMSLGRWWWGLPVWYSRMTRLSVHDRVIAMLEELSRKFGVRDSRGIIINLALGRDALADLIGASRQTVSLEIEKLVRHGRLIRDGRRLLLTCVRARPSISGAL